MPLHGRNTREGAHRDTLRFLIPGWDDIQHGPDMELWQDLDGDFLGLVRSRAALGLPPLSDEEAVRRHCRLLAERMESGLIEAVVVHHVQGPAIEFIAKRLKMSAFVFTGVLMVPTPEASWVWTMSAEEHGVAGIREATITAQLMKEGRLTFDSHATSWARDPYDPTYHRIDSLNLHYLSDEERYDRQFPDHPLSRVRRELGKLVTVTLDG